MHQPPGFQRLKPNSRALLGNMCFSDGGASPDGWHKGPLPNPPITQHADSHAISRPVHSRPTLQQAPRDAFRPTKLVHMVIRTT